MTSAAKVLVLNDHSYVSPYLMRPLRRLDEVQRSQTEAGGASDGAKPAANDAKPRRHPGSDSHAVSAARAGRR